MHPLFASDTTNEAQHGGIPQSGQFTHVWPHEHHDMSTQRARGGRKRQNKTPQRGEEVTFEASTDHVAWNLGPHLQNKPLVLFLLPVPRMRRERKGKGPTTAVESLSYPPGNDGSRGRERPTATATATSFDRCFLSLSLSPPSLVRSLSTLATTAACMYQSPLPFDLPLPSFGDSCCRTKIDRTR